MNPRAMTFTPGTCPPEPDIDNGSHKLLPQNNVPAVLQEEDKKAEHTGTRDALDPGNYDAMFPSLETANQKVNPPTIADPSSKTVRKKRRATKKASKKEGKKVIELSSGPYLRAGTPMVSTKLEEVYDNALTISRENQDKNKTITSSMADITECEKKPVVSTFPPVPLSPHKYEAIDLAQFAQNMPPTPKSEHDITLEQQMKIRGIPADFKASSNTTPTDALPVPPSSFPPMFGHPSAMASPFPWPGNGYVFLYPQNPMLHSQSFMSGTIPPVPMSQTPQVPLNQVFSHPGSFWPPMRSMNPPRAPYTELWRAAAARHFAHTFRASSSLRESPRGHRESRPCSQIKSQSSSATLINSKPNQPPAGPSMNQRATMAHLASRTNITQQPILNKVKDGEDKEKPSAVKEERVGSNSVFDEENKLANPATSVAPKEQHSQSTTPVPEGASPNNQQQHTLKAARISRSQRSLADRDSFTPVQSTASIHSSDKGSWSQSKRWVSAETKERATFQKMLMNLHYMGADKSPFIPQSPAELTALKADAAESQRTKLLQKVGKLISKSSNHDSGHPVTKIFQGKKLEDNFSSVFGVTTCFNKGQSEDNERHADWPTLAELKGEGDKRAMRHSRYFPLPRLNTVAPQTTREDDNQGCASSGSVHCNTEEIRLGSAGIPPTNAESPYDRKSASRFDMTEIPASLEEIFNYIEKMETDEQVTKEVETQQDK